MRPCPSASRRDVLGLLAGSLLAAVSGCASHGAPRGPARPALPPLATARLVDLLPRAGLRWLVIARPRAIAAMPWLAKDIAAIAPDAGWERLLAASGVDVRRLDEACIASYEGGATIHLVRHDGDAQTIERRFRARITGGERRVSSRPDVVRVVGTVGERPHALVLLGRDVAAFQDGGSVRRGPARIAEAYASFDLQRSPAALADDPLRTLAARLGAAPALALAEGPFEGDLARGARGLLAAATSIGAAARPAPPSAVAVTIALTGAFGADGDAAALALEGAWGDLAGHRFGHLLGLDEPASAARASSDAEGLALRVDLASAPLARGLAMLTSDELATLMR